MFFLEWSSRKQYFHLLTVFHFQWLINFNDISWWGWLLAFLLLYYLLLFWFSSPCDSTLLVAGLIIIKGCSLTLPGSGHIVLPLLTPFHTVILIFADFCWLSFSTMMFNGWCLIWFIYYSNSRVVIADGCQICITEQAKKKCTPNYNHYKVKTVGSQFI